MLVIRPIALTDLEDLESLAVSAGIGLTSLPNDPKWLRKRIKFSMSSFEGLIDFADEPGDFVFLFVLEDLETKRVVGICGIYSKVGGFEPFYSYKIETEVFNSSQLGIHKEVPILKLHEDHNGPSEIGSLFLHPDFRKDGNGRFLQLIRFLFTAEYPQVFEETVITEIRGVNDSKGNSPFWDAIGRHFFGIEFARADHLSIVNKRFIAELMPDHPIYITMLPDSAREVIGKPHEISARAFANLKSEGFEFADMVDIFDAGPILHCRREQIRCVRESMCAQVVGAVNGPMDGPPYMICTSRSEDRKPNDFRAVCSEIQIESPARVRLSRDAMNALNITDGSMIRYSTLRPRK